MKLKLTAPTDSTFVATLGGKTVSATAVNDLAVLNMKEVGTWHVEGTDPNGATWEMDYFVPPGGLVAEITLNPPPKASLEPTAGVTYTEGISNLTQSQLNICAMAISNNANITEQTSVVYVDDKENKGYYKVSVGDNITIAVDDGNYEFVVIGFNHDELADTLAYGVETATGKAGLTLHMKNVLTTKYNINNADSNTGGWRDSVMRGRMDTFLGTMSSDWQKHIKQVNKLSSAGAQSSTIYTTVDKLWLLSEVEIYGVITKSKAGEGTQYAWYAAGNSKAKISSEYTYWWERSPVGSAKNLFCMVSYDGSTSDGYTSHLHHVALCFCI